MALCESKVGKLARSCLAFDGNIIPPPLQDPCSSRLSCFSLTHTPVPCRCLCCWRRLQLYSQPLLGSRTMKCLGSAPRALTQLPHWNPQQPVKCTGEFVLFTPW